MFNRKLIVALLTLVLVVSLSIGGTFAWLNATSDAVTNTFKPGVITTEVEETLDNGIKSNVSIKNTTTNDNGVDAYIRVEVVATWQKLEADGSYTVYGKAPVATDYYILGINLLADENGGQWIQAKDGFWYWTMPVAPGENTGILIDSCRLENRTDAPKGYSLCVEVISTAIQTVPTSVVTTEWGTGVSAVAENGELIIIK